MRNPYQGLSETAFWRPAVAETGPHGISDLWTPRFRIRKSDVVVTAGSCFAQHIGRALADNGYAWTDFEPAPPYLPQQEARDFGYGVFSTRTGNVYTASLLLQWLQLAYGERDGEDEVWEQDGRVYDPPRPAIEPDGFADQAEFLAARQATYGALRQAVEKASVFVFTLGLTEHWRNKQSGLEYAMCPGTVAGVFDETRHVFANANARKVSRDLRNLLRFLRGKNPKLRVLLTVSPVPLTATASGQHVLTATSYSKSTLRAAAGMALEDNKWVDYFPSYEIITHPAFRGMYFAPNMRNVEPAGVARVMQHFFADQERVFGKSKTPKRRNAQLLGRAMEMAEKDVKCEEAMLDAFAR